jgi:polar amino acid transport system substrate-binding protein
MLAVMGILASAIAKPQFSFAAEWSEITARGQIVVGVKDDLRPLGFTDESGKLTGLEIDIARKLAAELLGDRDAVEFVTVTNQQRLQAVLEDRVDIAIAKVTVTTPRTRIVDFSPYYYLDGTGLITKQPNIKNLNSLRQSKIAVLENSATIAVIRHELPNAELVGVDSYQAALELLETGKADAFASDRTILTGWTQEYPEYRLLSDRLSAVPLCIVMPKGLQYQELRQKINDAIASWQESGWLQERIEYWGL